MYDPYTLFWMGVIEMSYSPTAPIVALFLTLDRICVLKPLEWIGQMRKSLFLSFYIVKLNDGKRFRAHNFEHHSGAGNICMLVWSLPA